MQRLFLLSIFCNLTLFSCNQNSLGPVEQFKIPTDAEMPKIIYSGSNIAGRNLFFRLEIDQREGIYHIIDCDNEQNNRDVIVEISQQLWDGLKATTNREALQNVKMQPRCGNFLEYVALLEDSLQYGFGFALGSSLETIPRQIEGATESVLGFIQQLRRIDLYCYQQIDEG